MNKYMLSFKRKDLFKASIVIGAGFSIGMVLVRAPITFVSKVMDEVNKKDTEEVENEETQTSEV